MCCICKTQPLGTTLRAVSNLFSSSLPMLNIIPSSFIALFNSASHSGHRAPHRPSSRSDKNPGFPVQDEQGFVKFKPPHAAHEARMESCSAVNDASNTANPDYVPLSVVNCLRSHPPLSVPLSSFGSHDSEIVNEYESSQLECPADDNDCPTDGSPLRDTGHSSGPGGGSISTANDARERLDLHSSQESSSTISSKSTSDFQTVNRTDSSTTPLTPDSGNADLSWHGVHRALDPTGAVLTQELQEIVNEALALYESLRSIKFLSDRSAEVSAQLVTLFRRPQTNRSVRSSRTPFPLMQMI